MLCPHTRGYSTERPYDQERIIEKTLREVGPFPIENEPPFSGEQDEEEFITSVLQDKLPDSVEIKTCEDFKHLGVECCEICHGRYAHYEMKVIDLPKSGKAWVCGPVKRAIYPEEFKKLRESRCNG